MISYIFKFLKACFRSCYSFNFFWKIWRRKITQYLQLGLLNLPKHFLCPPYMPQVIREDPYAIYLTPLCQVTSKKPINNH